VLYDFGKGVPRNYAKARQWCEKAASQGRADAQVSQGILLVYARGGQQNSKIAVGDDPSG
jgi:TPR repeat protein